MFCITRGLYFSTSPLTPFAKLIESWPFSNRLQEIDLCVHALLGKAWMKSKAGGKWDSSGPYGHALALSEGTTDSRTRSPRPQVVPAELFPSRIEPYIRKFSFDLQYALMARKQNHLKVTFIFTSNVFTPL